MSVVKSKGGLSQAMIYFLFLMMVVTGSINTIAKKLQMDSISLTMSYSHTWFITFCMFLGESTCIIWYLILNKKDNETPLLDSTLEEITPREVLKEASPFLLALPALCDFFGSTIMTFGLTMMAGSVYQMFRGSLIFFTALFSVIFLKNTLYRHNYLALVTVIGGLALVGLGTMLTPPSLPDECKDDTQSSILGVILVIIAQNFSATQFILEERFMKGYKCHPLKAVGWEGIWGSLIYIVLLIIFQFIPCEDGGSLTKYICTQDDKKKWLLENTLFAFRQIANNGLLLFYVILYLCSIAVYNFFSISVSKYASSPARAVIISVRTVVVWAFFLLPILSVCKREHFIIFQFVGFILLVLGTLLYNEILVIPFLGFNMYTKAAIEERKKLEQLPLVI